MTEKSRLILVDGLPGAGKSSTAQFLALQFQRQQIPARWFYELDHNHPVHAFHVWSRKGPEAFIDASLRKWAAFVQANRDCATINILESTFFQSSVRLLLQSDLPVDRIHRYAFHVADMITPLHPVFLYLPSGDVAEAIQEICRHRKRFWEQYFIQVIDGSRYAKARDLHGFEGVVAFFEEYQRVMTDIYARLTMPKITCEHLRQRWPACRQRICDYFGIRYVPDPPLDPEAAAQYVGRYRDSQTRLELRVQREQQHLVVCDLLWPKSRLILNHDHCFDVEACTIALTFTPDGDGIIQSMTIGGSSGWKFYGRTLAKIDERQGDAYA